jgi:hypothetical protein
MYIFPNLSQKCHDLQRSRDVPDVVAFGIARVREPGADRRVHEDNARHLVVVLVRSNGQMVHRAGKKKKRE